MIFSMVTPKLLPGTAVDDVRVRIVVLLYMMGGSVGWWVNGWVGGLVDRRVGGCCTWLVGGWVWVVAVIIRFFSPLVPPPLVPQPITSSRLVWHAVLARCPQTPPTITQDCQAYDTE